MGDAELTDQHVHWYGSLRSHANTFIEPNESVHVDKLAYCRGHQVRWDSVAMTSKRSTNKQCTCDTNTTHFSYTSDSGIAPIHRASKRPRIEMWQSATRVLSCCVHAACEHVHKGSIIVVVFEWIDRVHIIGNVCLLILFVHCIAYLPLRMLCAVTSIQRSILDECCSSDKLWAHRYILHCRTCCWVCVYVCTVV